MTQQEFDRVRLTTHNYLRKVREALDGGSNAANIAAAIAMSTWDNNEGLRAAAKAYEQIAEGTSFFVRALSFLAEDAQTETEVVESLRKARSVASFAIGEIEHSANSADTAGAWMLARGVYDACESAKRAQTVAWEAEQAIQ